MPEDIVKWNIASDDWHSPQAENDLHVGEEFNYLIEAKARSSGFDFWGVYEKVMVNELIEYTLGNGRKVKISFTTLDNKTKVVETFEAESTNPIEMQRVGW